MSTFFLRYNILRPAKNESKFKKLLSIPKNRLILNAVINFYLYNVTSSLIIISIISLFKIFYAIFLFIFIYTMLFSYNYVELKQMSVHQLNNSIVAENPLNNSFDSKILKTKTVKSIKIEIFNELILLLWILAFMGQEIQQVCFKLDIRFLFSIY